MPKAALRPQTPALVVSLPWVPYSAGPPLGPATLVGHAEAMGVRVEQLDLGIRFLEGVPLGSYEHDDHEPFVGDHAKNQGWIDSARTSFRLHSQLPCVAPHRLPCCGDLISSLPHSFDELQDALAAMERDGFWPDFFGRWLFLDRDRPSVLGLSIMGPEQVPLGLLLARLVRRHWPGTQVVAGGSHVTLLASEIAADPRYGVDIDAFLPGHSEAVFARVIRARTPLRDQRGTPGVLVAGEGRWNPAPEVHPAARHPPRFDQREFRRYDPLRLSLPIQLVRGCAYGKCTMCTYPAVEALDRRAPEAQLRRHLQALLSYDVPRWSFKDSLLDIKRLQSLGRTIEQMAPHIRWSATTKISQGMTGHTMETLARQGLRTLELGIETIHARGQVLLDKRQSTPVIQDALDACLGAGITVVINLLYGLPGERLEQALTQLEWFESWRRRYPGQVKGSHNMLDINRSAPMARSPERFGIELGPIGPWAFTYPWNAPAWRPEFRPLLLSVTRAGPAKPHENDITTRRSVRNFRRASSL